MSSDLADQRFFNAMGEIFFEPDGIELMREKIADLARYKEYEKSFDLSHLFPHISKEVQATWNIEPRLYGQWFCRLFIGEQVTIGKDCTLFSHGGVTIGTGTHIGNNVLISTVSHPTDHRLRKLMQVAPIEIEENVTIGSGSIILNPGRGRVVIPSGTVLLRNSVVYTTVNGANFLKLSVDDFQEKNIINRAAYFCHEQGLVTWGDVIISANGTNLMFSVGPNKMTPFVNHGGKLFVPDSSRATFGEGFMMGPRAALILGENAEIEVSSMVWLGAGAKVQVADGCKLHIGYGSVIAAGVNYLASANAHIPESTLVLGQHRFKEIMPLLSEIPVQWTNKDYINRKNL